MKDQDRLHTLIAFYLTEQISEAEHRELENMLRDSSEARRVFRQSCRVDLRLQQASMKSGSQPSQTERTNVVPFKWPLVGLAAAIAVMLGVMFWPSSSSPEKTIATLLSTENATWETITPTRVGDGLEKGELQLTSGMATVRFHSGAELTLEGPAALTLESPMEAKLTRGAALIAVPESAVGFVLKTPDGYAVDYGTEFVVTVDEASKHSRFQLIEGEIAVHHPPTGQEVRLVDQENVVTVSADFLTTTKFEGSDAAVDTSSQVVRLRTHGRSTSVRKNLKAKRRLNREVLWVKKTNSGRRDHFGLFAFDLSQTNLSQFSDARLWLNMIPSGKGFASRLPKVNRFAVYGVVNPSKDSWKEETTWVEAPKPEDGILIGHFEVSRSQQRGRFSVGGPVLMDFLHELNGRPASFILVRETSQIDGFGPGLMHHFASDHHPEMVGPILEFTSPNL